MKELSYSDVPRNWAVCFQSDCPLAANCLRHHAAQLLPADVLVHHTVLPTARTADGCRLFVEDAPAVIARGMKRLFDGLESWQAQKLRKSVIACFGSRAQFYRYRDGHYPLTPEQMGRIQRIFRQFDENREPQFDNVTESYYFPKP